MKKTKTQKGITLVALVITIIVLLILAVVAIGAVQDSKIIVHSQGAKDAYNAGKEEEQLKLAVMEAMLAGNGKYDPSNLELPYGFTKNPDNTVTGPSATIFEVNSITGEVVNLGTEISGTEGNTITPPGIDNIIIPGPEEGGNAPATPTVQSLAWSHDDLKFEIAGQPVNVTYDAEYYDSKVKLGDETEGVGIKILANGGLEYSVGNTRQALVSDTEAKYYISINRAHSSHNFISFWYGGYDMYVGFKFNPDKKTVDVYWEEPTNEDGSGPIKSIEGLTPVGTISIVE